MAVFSNGKLPAKSYKAHKDKSKQDPIKGTKVLQKSNLKKQRYMNCLKKLQNDHHKDAL